MKSTYSNIVDVQSVVLLGTEDPLDDVEGSYIWVLKRIVTLSNPSWKRPWQSDEFNVGISLFDVRIKHVKIRPPLKRNVIVIGITFLASFIIHHS